jgi:hypothetical protein
MNQENPCRCARKTRASIEAGYVDPQHLQFHSTHVERVKTVVTEEAHRINDALDLRAQNLFRDHPFQKSPNYVQVLKDMLEHRTLKNMLNFN